MPAAEIRSDIWTGREVIVAGDRADRPQTVSARQADLHDATGKDLEAKLDPFLEGREEDTPSERLALRCHGSPRNEAGWLLRVVANRYPAVAPFTDSRLLAAQGIHDVVIECPDFRRCWLQFSTAEVARVLIAWQMRQRQLLGHPEVKSIQVFRNQGAAAGASLGHSHSQIISLGSVPKLLQQRLKNAEGFQRWRAFEMLERHRVVVADRFLVICPDASWVAGQLRVCFGAAESAEAEPFHRLPVQLILELADVLRRCVSLVMQCFPGASFNVVLNQPSAEHLDAFPWSIDLMPRTASFAGFELSCDIPIITTSPESAAGLYRAAWERPFDKTSNGKLTELELWPENYSWQPS